MMTKLVILVMCSMMTKTMIEQHLFVSVLYYGQIKSCWNIFEEIDIFTSLSKASGFTVYFLIIWHIFFFFFSNLEISKGINSAHAFGGHNNFQGI